MTTRINIQNRINIPTRIPDYDRKKREKMHNFHECLVTYSNEGNLDKIIEIFGNAYKYSEKYSEKYECMLARYRTLFWNSCQYGHLHIIHWILEEQHIDIPIEVIHRSFPLACFSGNKELVELFLARYPNDIDISRNNGEAFNKCCLRGHIHLAKRLLEINPNYNISLAKELAFRTACKGGHVEMVKWLYKLKPDINVFAVNHYAFITTCEYQRINVALFLTTICPYHYELILNEDKTMIEHYSLRAVSDIKWLERRLPLVSYYLDVNTMFSSMPFDTVKMICEFI